jgi:flagellar basal body-associated protein FliL
MENSIEMEVKPRFHEATTNINDSEDGAVPVSKIDFLTPGSRNSLINNDVPQKPYSNTQALFTYPQSPDTHRTANTQQHTHTYHHNNNGAKSMNSGAENLAFSNLLWEHKILLGIILVVLIIGIGFLVYTYFYKDDGDDENAEATQYTTSQNIKQSPKIPTESHNKQQQPSGGENVNQQSPNIDTDNNTKQNTSINNERDTQPVQSTNNVDNELMDLLISTSDEVPK